MPEGVSHRAAPSGARLQMLCADSPRPRTNEGLRRGFDRQAGDDAPPEAGGAVSVNERTANELACSLGTVRCPNRVALAREIEAALAAAEERGRRSGIESAQLAVDAVVAVCDLHQDVQYRNGALMAAEAVRALAPRNSLCGFAEMGFGPCVLPRDHDGTHTGASEWAKLREVLGK
jgi:hypothetical protein